MSQDPAAAASGGPALPARFEGDPGLFREAAEIFLEDGPLLVDSLRAALALRDARGVEQAAHTLKGMAGNFAHGPAADDDTPAGRVVSAARALEALTRGRDLAGAEALAAALDAAFGRLRDELAARVAAAVA
jgi:HPt (histidine-containing phosphotransfer) domain-containing protein